MARPRLHPFWRDEIRKTAEANPGIKATAVVRYLSEEIANETLKIPAEVRPNVPEERAVRKILKEYSTLLSEERIPYRYFQWPESMISGALPWEASEALMDLLRYLQEQRDERRKKDHDPNTVWADNRPVRPTVSQAWWFWRLTQTAPKTKVPERWEWACGLTFNYSKPEHLEAMRRLIESVLVKKTYLTDIEKPSELSTELQAAVESHFAWVPVSELEPKAKTRESRTHKKRLRKRGTK
jgi:hypothetical protein